MARRTQDDDLLMRLGPDERRRFSVDAWEPSLLRKLLLAQNKLKR